MGRRGKPEFVQVQRLLESFKMEEVHAAVKDALRLGALSFDAVKHLVLCGLEGRPPRLDLDLYPYLLFRWVGFSERAISDAVVGLQLRLFVEAVSEVSIFVELKTDEDVQRGY